jgi:hypothetical protein
MHTCPPTYSTAFGTHAKEPGVRVICPQGQFSSLVQTASRARPWWQALPPFRTRGNSPRRHKGHKEDHGDSQTHGIVSNTDRPLVYRDPANLCVLRASVVSSFSSLRTLGPSLRRHKDHSHANKRRTPRIWLTAGRRSCYESTLIATCREIFLVWMGCRVQG